MPRLLAKHPHLTALLALGIIAAVLRLGVLLRAPAFITNDSLSYLLPGFDLASGLGFDPIFKRPPGYPLFVAAVLWLFGRQDLTGLLLLQHLIGVVTVLLAYGLGAALFGRLAGWVAGLLTALSGPLILTEHYLMSETLFGLLLAGSVLALVAAGKTARPSWIAAAGLLLGLAALTRPVAQILVLLFMVVIVVTTPRRRAGLGGVALLVACYLAVVLPWMLRNAVHHHSFVLAGGLGEGLAVRTIRLDQSFSFRPPAAGEPLEQARRIFWEEAAKDSVYDLARRLREEAGLTPAEADRAMRDIALEAIAGKPRCYVSGSLEMFMQMLIGRPVRLRQDWQPWRGIVWEERVQHLWPTPTPEQDRQFHVVRGIVTLYDPARWWPLTLTLFAIGCIAAAATRHGLGLVPAGTALLLLLLSAFLVGIEWRYRYPLDPLLHAMIGNGVAAVGGLVARWRDRVAALEDERPLPTEAAGG